jgi:hypothetical protein
MGGSAYSMAREIAGGFINVTERTFRSMADADIRQLLLEIEKSLRELRGSQLATDEMEVVRGRNHKIQRLNNARMVARHFRQKRRKPGAIRPQL